MLMVNVSNSCRCEHTVCLRNDNNMLLWGSNKHGQPGLKNVKSTYVSHPQPDGIQNGEIADVECGDYHTGCLTKSGQIYIWGFKYASNPWEDSTRDSEIIGVTEIKEIK